MPAFSAGFRAFFVLAPLYAGLAMLLWLGLWQGYVDMALPVAPAFWHGHEMLFGYAAAVLAGFLLTAVPNWTNAPPVAGARLMLLVGVWFAARLAAWLPQIVPPSIAMAFDLAFLPLLGLLVAPAILRYNARRNGVFVLVLLLLTLVNLRYHLAALGSSWGDAGWSLQTGLGLFILLIAVVGGRILPNFTANWLKSQANPAQVRPQSLRDRLALLALALTVVAEAAGAPDLAVGALCAVACVLHAWRMVGWQSLQTLKAPILAVLHLGYAWLVAGLALKAVSLLGGLLPITAAIHALTAGAVGTMTIAVMSRAALGHIGRPLVASRMTVVAYGLVTAAALLRVTAGLFVDPYYSVLVGIAGAAWILAFAAFLFAYAPLLWRRSHP
jgi:uncharacterized protein involved in response to NO